VVLRTSALYVHHQRPAAISYTPLGGASTTVTVSNNKLQRGKWKHVSRTGVTEAQPSRLWTFCLVWVLRSNVSLRRTATFYIL